MIQFIVAFVELVGLARAVWNYIEKVSGDDPRKFVRDTRESFEKLRRAETEEEKREAAHNLAKLLNSL